MEQKKISQCETLAIGLNSVFTDAYLAAINKNGGTFQNYKVSLNELLELLRGLSSRIDGMSGEESPGEETTPTPPADLTEVNNRLTLLENEISNFKNSNNWPVNTIKLTNNAGDIIATYDLPSNYLGSGYTEDDSIVIQVNSDASPRYDLTFELSTCDIDSENDTFTIPFRVKCIQKTGQQGGVVTGLRVDGDINTGSTTMSFTGIDLIQSNTTITTSGYNSGWQDLTVTLQGADTMTITSTVQLKLNGSTDPIITLTTVCDKGSSSAVSRMVIITT